MIYSINNITSKHCDKLSSLLRDIKICMAKIIHLMYDHNLVYCSSTNVWPNLLCNYNAVFVIPLDQGKCTKMDYPLRN